MWPNLASEITSLSGTITGTLRFDPKLSLDDKMPLLLRGFSPTLFERSLKRFCKSILAKWKISALNLFESRCHAGRVFKAPATSFRLTENVLGKSKRDLGNSL
jgi:hypothetical protein